MAEPDAAVFRHEFVAMTTKCELQFHGAAHALANTTAQQIESRVMALERRYNFHSLSSWLTTHVNNRRRDSVPIDAECAAVLRIVRHHAELTQGAFDITVGTMAGQLRRARTAIEAAAIRRRLAAYSGLDRWELRTEGDLTLLHFDNAYTRIDLGGVIKEHAVDVAACMAQKAGITSGLVNFGGDVFAFGRRSNQARFVASVPHPLHPENMLFALDLEDQALATSAHYARRRFLRGSSAAAAAVQLSHVDHTRNASSGGQTRWISASVVSRTALVSGIYSTALLVNSQLTLPRDVLAVVVDADGQPQTLGGGGDNEFETPVTYPSNTTERTLECAST